MNLQKKVVMVTGATGGVGRVVAQRFYDEKCKLVLTYQSERKLSDLPKDIIKDSANVLTVQADLTKEDEVAKLFDKAIETFSEVSILCNVVGGYMDTKPFTELTLDEWSTMMDRNLTACFLTCREAFRRIEKNTYGRIINFSAKPGIYPEAERGAYGVAKGGVAFLTRMLGEEFKRSGITVNAIAPSIIKTPANESWGEPEDMKHWITPEQLADTMVFLCRDEAKSINGAVIEAFGGV